MNCLQHVYNLCIVAFIGQMLWNGHAMTGGNANK